MVLGSVKVWRKGVELPLGPPKQHAVLALLLLHAGQTVGLSQIVDVLWHGDPPNSAVNVVHRHIGSLRKLLEPELPPRAPGGLLVRHAGGYGIDADVSTLDLLHFRELVARARSTADGGEVSGVAELYTQALSLWRGEAAQGVPADIRVHPLFSAVDSEHLAALREGTDLMLALGTPAPVLPLLHRAIAQYPLDESLHARLIQALARTGRQAEAFGLFQEMSLRLKNELGIEPGRELRLAHASLLSRPERATPPKAPPATPAPPAPAIVRPTQLPLDLRTFVGRRDELARITNALDKLDDSSPTPSAVINTIEGMAGVGKTALAVHLAHRLAPRFPDGQLYVNLRGFDASGPCVTAAEALRSFLIALGVSARHLPADLDSQMALYRSILADRRVLIVLDNARDSQHVRPLLPGSCTCLVLITSRTQLRGLVATHGAAPLILGPLSEEESREVLARHLGRGRTAAEPEAVDAIVAFCHRLPLALAVIAARAATLPGFSLSSIAAELRAGHDSLDAFADDDPYTDLRTVFSWSLDGLGPEAARLLRLLSLHPGPDLSATAAASLAALSVRRTTTLLAKLADAHLMIRPLSNRFAFHDMLKIYASEQLQDHDDDATRAAAVRRLLDHYVHGAHTATTALTPHRIDAAPASPAEPGVELEPLTDPASAAAWLERELPVLLATVGQARSGGHPAHAWVLAQTLELYLDRRGRWQDQIDAQTIAVEAARLLRDRLREAKARRALGFAYGRLAQDDRAQAELDAAMALFTELGDASGQARAHRSLGFLANGRDDHEAALRHYALALDLYRSVDHLTGQALVLNETGWTYILHGAYRQAVAECTRAVSLHQRSGDTNGEAAAWDSLGYAHHHMGQHQEALRCYERALKLYQRMNDRYLEADTLLHMGDTHEARGSRTASVPLWREAVRILDELGHPEAEQARARLRSEPAATTRTSGGAAG
ncbi:AfsR/SARP family transcriptional regulator [Streptomyces acidiscabies]|uniref:AfsR/SARP family transcriptional regulator n=1 Tax=Streptomyces acidiscabies TaxID=42234 RepID=UPI0009A0BA11|nr:BTAD domain-containing putative transcriptional regulator [Streptomyces acidiscabies]